MINPLNDKKFLYELDKQKNHTTYIKILALDKDEHPLQQIEGRATGGSISVDGNSAVRRTCSLTMISEQYDIIDAHWALKNKFKLEIGIKNTTNQYLNYPIIWFKMGTFGINAFSKNQTTTGITLNISGQDKMCFLNGTLGGSLTASTNFGEEEFINDDGSITLKKIPLKDIVTKAIHTYANEPMHNIIIRDLDDVGYELWDFKGGSDEAMYVFYTKNENSAEYDQIFNTTFMGNMKVKLDDQNILLSEITNDELYHRNRISDNDGVVFTLGETNVKISKVLYGEAAGYYKTPLIYAGDLIVNAGSPLTQMLDNIKNMLGEYEYFYDVDGHFIFQKKKTYIQGIVNFDGSLPITSLPEYSYKFEDEELMTSIQITPTIADVRNDLAVWGSKKSITGATLAPYGRVAIQAKPTKYVAFDGSVYSIEEDKTVIKNSSGNITLKNIDWREIIYQMAKDYMEHHDEYDFEVRLAANNTPMFSTGKTGYEQYYTDMLGFWRDLYWTQGLDEPAAANFNPSDYLPSGWHVNKEYSPESLLFWFDLLEPNGGLNPYAIETIGDRTKVDNNKSATSLYIKETPNILFAIREKDNDSTTGELDFTKINISQSIADNVFSISTQGKSVLDALDELIYKHVLLAEGINLSLIPVYHIEPNTRIYLKNTDSDYIVTQMSIPLAYNGTMSITATKIVPYIN